MAILDDYRKKITVRGNTSRDRTVSYRSEVFLETFKSKEEYEQVKVALNDETNSTLYDSWIYSNSSYKHLVSMKTIIFPPNTDPSIVFSGQYVRPQRQGGLFMMVSSDDQYQDKLKAKIDSCTETLRWYDEDGNLLSYPVVVMKSYNKDTDADKYLVRTKGEYILGIPQNEQTFKLQEGDEFILNKKHKYRISGFEDVESDTFMTLYMEKYEENPEVDNLELGIANYVNRPRFTIDLENNNSQIAIGNTAQLSFSVKDKDGNVVSKPVTFASSDTNIATVDENGLVTAVANGNVGITCTMTNNQNVSSSVNVEVVAVPVDNFELRVAPDVDFVRRGLTTTFTTSTYNNGSQVSESYIFTDITTSISGQYQFNVIDSNSFSIECQRAGGSVVIRVTGQTTSVTRDITIELRSLF